MRVRLLGGVNILMYEEQHTLMGLRRENTQSLLCVNGKYRCDFIEISA